MGTILMAGAVAAQYWLVFQKERAPLSPVICYD